MARINIYCEEISDRVEIVEKTTADGTFTGLRIYLELPVTLRICRYCEALDTPGVTSQYCSRGPSGDDDDAHDFQPRNIGGPFMHHPGDDDSSAVTFWGKKRLREVLQKALDMLDAHYGPKGESR